MRLQPAAIEDITEVLGALTPPNVITVEPIGPWFHYYQQHEDDHNLLSSSSEEEEEANDEDAEFDKENLTLLLGLDPAQWKSQDHYMVLGLSSLRHKATEEQIKRTYRKMVLLHHPDKKRARGDCVPNGDDYFASITQAYEILGNPVKRRSFDSVDPEFDDYIPSGNLVCDSNFFEKFQPVFEANSRWSTKRNVPQLGDHNTSFELVNKFYQFCTAPSYVADMLHSKPSHTRNTRSSSYTMPLLNRPAHSKATLGDRSFSFVWNSIPNDVRYEFDSWREFSYKDEEDKEKGENRDERRWIEKQNKAARLKLKREENARMRQLVDTAYSHDPRILKFKEVEREKKMAARRAKQEAARCRVMQEKMVQEAAMEEERRRKELDEQEARSQAAVARKEKDIVKKQMRKERKTLRGVAKDFDYFAENADDRLRMLAGVDMLAELLPLVSLQELNTSLSCGDREVAKEALDAKISELHEQLERDKRQLLDTTQRSSSKAGEGKNGKKWSEDELQALIKAVKLFPAGTVNRWDVVAAFIIQHIDHCNKNAQDVLYKAKELKKNDATLRHGALTQAFSNFEKEHISSASGSMEAPTVRLETLSEAVYHESGTSPTLWTSDEQKLLEQAMKTFGASVPDRWDRIAECMGSRSRKDCMKRYKELCELVKAKKAAQQAAAKTKG